MLADLRFWSGWFLVGALVATTAWPGCSGQGVVARDADCSHDMVAAGDGGPGPDGSPSSDATVSPDDGTGSAPDALTADAGADATPLTTASLPLVMVKDIDLPGTASRFDYQDIDRANNHLVATHLADGSILILDLADGSVLKELKNIPTARGVIVADDINVIFVTSSPDQLVLIDSVMMTEIKRVQTGSGPDGVGWDPDHQVVGVSDQRDGAISLIPDGGNGQRVQVPLGVETGNVVYDAGRGWFWITVVMSSPPDQLIAIDPTSAAMMKCLPLPGCEGAHGLRIHPDGQSAFIACENNDMLARVNLEGDHAVSIGSTGAGPDVLSIDPGLGWLYVAAESGDLTVFDITKPGVSLVGHDSPGPNSHSVAADPATHRTFFPIAQGPNGTPVMRIFRPGP
jgi:DNA-binding beta-propeller fold protein YncE